METLIDPVETLFCSQPEVPSRLAAFNIDGERQRVILLSIKKWLNGSTITYGFFPGVQGELDSVRKAFRTWKELGIGLEFKEVPVNTAMVRISFQKGAGSWSYVGRDVLMIQSGPTMNFGWDITNDQRTVLHEIGHTLGLMHEHQNPLAGIEWNEPAVYAALAAPPNNWSRETTYNNIIRKLLLGEINGSTHDPASVMHYPFGRGLITAPVEYQNGIYPPGTLSTRDIDFVRLFYPPLVKADYIRILVKKRQPISLAAGEQINFVFKPVRTRVYNIHTSGNLDTVMVLFEKTEAGEITLAGDDNSGSNANARIVRELTYAKTYIIRIRLFHTDEAGSPSVIIT